MEIVIPRSYKLAHLSEIITEIEETFHGYLYADTPLETLDENSLFLAFPTETYEKLGLEEIAPKIAATYHLNKIMGLELAKEALQNAFLQKEHPQQSELLRALAFHAIHDGFLELD
jgi:hypothetical protein